MESVGEMILMLPYPPSNNRYYRHWKGRVLLSREGHAYRKAGIAAAHGRPGLPIAGPVRVVLNVFPPTRWGQDLDNIPKAICDALQAAGVLENDRQIAELHVFRKPKAEAPCVMVGIEEIGEAA